MSSFAVLGGKVDQEGGAKHLLHLFRQGYAKALNVTQRGAGANMSVDVNVDSNSFGGALMATSALVPYYGWIDIATNTAVTTADPSNPRIDTVVAYVDLTALSSAVTNNVGAFKFKAVPGTPAASPSAPSGATIQASIGAGNPYVTLSNLAVGTAVSSIVNANITDTRLPMAFTVPFLYGGSNNTKGHAVPNVADDTVALLGAAQTFGVGTVLAGSVVSNPVFRQWDGWLDANESWAYASATTITVPTDATLKYQVGDKIKLTQSATLKYFYIVGVTATVLTITGGTDYTFTNNAITANAYSHEASPLNFPGYFNGTNAGGGGGTLKFSIVGRMMTQWGLTIQSGTILTGNATILGVSFPVSFATAPALTATLSNNSGSGQAVAFNAADTTTSAAANLTVQNISTGSITAKIGWIAVGNL